MVLRNATDSLNVETSQQTILSLLERLTNLMEHPVWQEYTSGRLRVVLDNVGGGAQTLGTVSTVTNMSQMSGYTLKDTLLFSTDRALWYQGARPRII